MLQVVEAIVGVLGNAVLQIGPIAEDGTQKIVTHQFSLGGVINLETSLPPPGPTATVDKVILIDFHRPRQLFWLRKRPRSGTRKSIPLHRRTHHLAIPGLRRRRLLSHRMAFASNAIVCLSQITHRTIARTIGKECPRKAILFASLKTFTLD